MSGLRIIIPGVAVNPDLPSIKIPSKLKVNSGYMIGAYTDGLDANSGFRVHERCTFTGTPTADVELIKRWGAGTSTRSWKLIIQADRILKLQYVTSALASGTRLSTLPLPGVWTDEINYRCTYIRTDPTNSNFTSFKFEWTTDNGETWSQLGDRVLLTSAVTLNSTAQPLIVASDGTTTFRGVDTIKEFAIESITSGAKIAGINFNTGEMPPGSVSKTDDGTAGVTFTLSGDAAIIA